MEFRTPATDKPTFFNKDAGLGALIGGALTLGPWGAAAGAAIGSYLGKSRMEKEAVEGKIVKEPSFWNKDTAIGGLLGHLGGAIAGAVAGLAVLAVFPHALLAAGAVYAATHIAGLAVGISEGGKAGRTRMDREYTEAAAQSQGMPAPNLARSQSQGHTTTVEYSVPDKSHAADELARRAAAQSPSTAQYLSGRAP